MMMMVIMVSTAPLPPSLLRCDGNSTETLCLQNITKEINSTTSRRFYAQCVLSTCLTANLGSSLQRGDEMAGREASDPFGPGRK
nr:uncharacterized protein zgc:193726 isoform X2 [Pseudochaenichthys georgianus]